MTGKTLFLGIDVSTTGAKALLIDPNGAVVSTATILCKRIKTKFTTSSNVNVT